jgi:ABC-2 type transport system permease protein
VIWIFGREFTDRTAKDLLALPTARTSIVAAKFAITGGWCLLLSLETYVLGLAAGALLRLPAWSAATAWQGLGRLLVTTVMTWWLLSVLALAASVGRGYLPAVGAMFVMLFLAQVVAALGYGHLFPWSVPAIYSGLAGPDRDPVGLLGYLLVGLVGAGGVLATLRWWRDADQSR